MTGYAINHRQRMFRSLTDIIDLSNQVLSCSHIARYAVIECSSAQPAEGHRVVAQAIPAVGERGISARAIIDGRLRIALNLLQRIGVLLNGILQSCPHLLFSSIFFSTLPALFFLHTLRYVTSSRAAALPRQAYFL